VIDEPEIEYCNALNNKKTNKVRTKVRSCCRWLYLLGNCSIIFTATGYDLKLNSKFFYL
jgi:hypothetical protein